MKRFLAFATLTVLIFAVATRLLAQNPAVGTWKLNLAKSKYSPGPGPKSMTRTVESQGAKVKYSFEGVAADGTTIAYSFTVSYDGKDYPVTGSGVPSGVDAIAIKQLNPNSYEATLKKAGQPVLISKTQISQDGKVSTITQTSPAGKSPVKNIAVYEKQ